MKIQLNLMALGLAYAMSSVANAAPVQLEDLTVVQESATAANSAIASQHSHGGHGGHGGHGHGHHHHHHHGHHHGHHHHHHGHRYHWGSQVGQTDVRTVPSPMVDLKS